ncbi:NAD(P)H-dependent D-xylose reductase (XR) [Rhizophlyctis rosea]|uniref:NAD(P)H-dependent D-xylose reductase (XR) n=1 Tax=Rhizophlyctis rosea TaxID=64517 RepID=A0AAD5X2C6_9FUNG|nr:NAD(P)H-dependent D-xylose reductase (XR) [Rhizophlyctis rosea]
MTSTATHLTLNRTGDKQPISGFGLWKVPKESAADTVVNVLKAGYRLLDNAADYGNEKEVGDGIVRAIKEGVVKREEIFVTSKLWNTNHAKEHVRPAFERTLKDLQCDYLDLYLIHFPISLKYVDPAVRYPPEWYYDGKGPNCTLENITIRETWEAMEELVDSGLVKNIGISNFNAALIQDLLKYARIKPAVLQIEHHPYLVQQDLIDYVQKNDIAVTGYSSFGAQSYIELGVDHAIKCPPLVQHDVITAISKKHNVTPAQVLLRWATQRNIAVIPKSNNPERLASNRDVFSFNLSADEIKSISALENGHRFNDPGFFFDIPIYA